MQEILIIVVCVRPEVQQMTPRLSYTNRAVKEKSLEQDSRDLQVLTS